MEKGRVCYALIGPTNDQGVMSPAHVVKVIHPVLCNLHQDDCRRRILIQATQARIWESHPLGDKSTKEWWTTQYVIP
eukprot:6101103-Pyramimonas_sp.AAC.2